MVEIRLTIAINLRRALALLTSLAQTATVIYSAEAMWLLALHRDGHVIAALRILSTASISSAAARAELLV
ncbi:hypothetical protein ACOSP7_001040 [Xanthoceras sorbifolium]